MSASRPPMSPRFAPHGTWRPLGDPGTAVRVDGVGVPDDSLLADGRSSRILSIAAESETSDCARWFPKDVLSLAPTLTLTSSSRSPTQGRSDVCARRRLRAFAGCAQATQQPAASGSGTGVHRRRGCKDYIRLPTTEPNLLCHVLESRLLSLTFTVRRTIGLPLWFVVLSQPRPGE